MLIKVRKGWELPESAVTPEALFNDRRRLMKGIGAGLIAAGTGMGGLGIGSARAVATSTADLYPGTRNLRYRVERPITSEEVATTYNNFYEFGSHKGIWKAAEERLKTDPWTIRVTGLIEKPFDIEFEDLVRRMGVEERVYRLRCVEAWAMTVPWSGFPLRKLVEMARPMSSAKYLKMETFLDKEMAPGQKQVWYPWPYVEGLTLEEANNDLAFMVTGAYGKPVPNQMGAPLRLHVPWKYGFKSIKSIVRFIFTDQRPKTFWEEVQPAEYGFWANVNPEVPHPRWSQATERLLETDERVPTRLYNGYGEFVADMYKNKQGERLFM